MSQGRLFIKDLFEFPPAFSMWMWCYTLTIISNYFIFSDFIMLTLFLHSRLPTVLIVWRLYIYKLYFRHCLTHVSVSHSFSPSLNHSTHQVVFLPFSRWLWSTKSIFYPCVGKRLLSSVRQSYYVATWLKKITSSLLPTINRQYSLRE